MKALRKKEAERNPLIESTAANSNRKPVFPTSSPPTTLELRGVTIHFPFRPYKCQEDYMGKVLDALHHSENALLESPTGTGKTLCLLCAALAWQREQARSLHKVSQPQATHEVPLATDAPNPPSRVPTIIYASRTHSQLSQVLRELKNTRYRPKHALLGSREQMCVNPKVKTARSTVADINHECSRLGKDRKCRFRNNLDGFQPEANEPGANGTQPVMDMEDLIVMGNTRKVCPFYYTRSLVQDAELILVPYNYLFDKDARDTTLQDVPWSNAVVIFDEAHNLESFASDSASFDLSSVDVAGCISEVQKAISYQQAMPELIDRVSTDTLVRMKSIFLWLEEYLLTKIPNDQNVFTGEFMMNIFKEGARITHDNHAIFVNEAKKVSEIIMDMRSGNSKGQTKIEFFIGCVKRVFGESTEGRCFAKARAYRVYVSSKVPGNNAKGRTISYWCFAPSLAMQELSNLNIRSIIVTSGTLSPLPSYTLELGIPFPHTLENPHIIADEQIHVRVIGTGVSGKQLSSSFNRRDDSDYLDELGCTIVNLARVVPDGMLIFFPSYGVMANCVEQWGGPASGRRAGSSTNMEGKNTFFAQRGKQQTGTSQFSFPHAPNFYGSSSQQNIWKRLLCQKAIILEPKSTSELPSAIADFHRYLNLQKSTGCILMGVCRGKISEGIDFAHHMCRAVLITGLPFAPYMDPKVKLKREYLDGIRAGQLAKPTGEGGFEGDTMLIGQSPGTCLSGIEWYTQQAHRAVNQAVGRVIRNKDDYGAVLLLDSRFGDPKNRDGLSKWVRTRVLQEEKFGMAVSGLGKFYREAKVKALEREVERAAIPVVAPRVGIMLAYENDTEDNDVLLTNKIAVVKSTADQSLHGNDEDITGDGADISYIPQDQVLATMDLATMQSNRSGIDPLQVIDNKPISIRETGLAGLYEPKPPTKGAVAGPTSSIAWPTLQKNENSVSKSNNASGSQNSSQLEPPPQNNPHTSAQIFFVRAKRKLDSGDFASLRKLLVAMKKHGDKNDSGAYMKAAGSLVDILVPYDNLECTEYEWEKSLLYLFFPLLPQVYQGDVQKVALKKQLARSDFIKHCRQRLPHEEHRSFYSSVFTALKLVYCIPTKQSFVRSKFLQMCLPVIEYIFKNDLHKKVEGTNDPGESNSMTILEMYFNLLPIKLRASAQAIFDEIRANASTVQIKEKEKQREGERGVDSSQFSQAPEIHRGLSKQASLPQNPEDLENQRSMQAALMMVEDANLAKRDRVKAELDREIMNAHKPSSKGTNMVQIVSTRPVKQPFKPSKVTANASARIPDKSATTKSNLTQEDRVSQLLRLAECSPFQNKSSKPKVRANTKASTCRICEKLCKEVSFWANTRYLSRNTDTFLSAVHAAMWPSSLQYLLGSVAEEIAKLSCMSKPCIQGNSCSRCLRTGARVWRTVIFSTLPTA